MDKTPQNEIEIQQVIRKFGEAWAQNDMTTLERLLSEDYIHTDYLGKVQNKVEWLEYVRDRKAKGGMNKIEFADVKVRLYGDVAVVTGRNIIKGALTEQGKEAGTLIRFTQVLLRKPEGWLRTTFQATPIP
jgi:ketosteroid isomerase-like protein